MSKDPPKAETKPRVTATVQQPRQATVKIADRPDLAETFADSITAAYFDGQTLRIDFGVTRWDQGKPNEAPSGRRYPACRLVLPPGAAADLINRLQRIANSLAQAGAAKRDAAAKPERAGS